MGNLLITYLFIVTYKRSMEGWFATWKWIWKYEGESSLDCFKNWFKKKKSHWAQRHALHFSLGILSSKKWWIFKVSRFFPFRLVSRKVCRWGYLALVGSEEYAPIMLIFINHNNIWNYIAFTKPLTPSKYHHFTSQHLERYQNMSPCIGILIHNKERVRDHNWLMSLTTINHNYHKVIVKEWTQENT